MADLSVLAQHVYAILVGLQRTQNSSPGISYMSLVAALKGEHGYALLEPQSKELEDALGEIAAACCGRAPKLPPLSVLVGRWSSRTGQSSGGFFLPARPYFDEHGIAVGTPAERGAAWRRCVEDVKRAVYPVDPDEL